MGAPHLSSQVRIPSLLPRHLFRSILVTAELAVFLVLHLHFKSQPLTVQSLQPLILLTRDTASLSGSGRADGRAKARDPRNAKDVKIGKRMVA